MGLNFGLNLGSNFGANYLVSINGKQIVNQRKTRSSSSSQAAGPQHWRRRDNATAVSAEGRRALAEGDLALLEAAVAAETKAGAMEEAAAFIVERLRRRRSARVGRRHRPPWCHAQI